MKQTLNTNIFCSALAICACFVLYASTSFASNWLPSSIDFRESAGDTPNLDRGMFSQIRVDNSLEFGPLESKVKNHRLYFVLNRFVDQAIPDVELKLLDESMSEVARSGQRVVVRFMYDWPSHELANSGLTLRRARTASPTMMSTHIRQLANVLKRHSKAVFAVESGLIGFWGEQHGDTPDKQTPSGVSAVVDQWRTALGGANILVLARYPKALREHLRSNPELLRQQPIVGFWNDCLGSIGDEYMITKDVKVVDGETCQLPALSDYSCGTMMSYFKKIQLNLLHSDFYRPTIDRWDAEGCLGELQQRLGYRYVIREVRMAADGRHLDLQVANVGWGQSLISRPLYLVSNGRRIQKIADLQNLGPESANLIHVELDVALDWKKTTLALETDDQIQFSNTTGNLLHKPLRLD